ncbi:type I polyketide synthase [Mycobacterium riyadhense]|uniref:type I polyketide synthase n=1 Tax=Mycobacterium riyadhense TaxID=486698 RepID=UPI00194FF25F|nr:type I polyketide synthase [Mycobacterium riyadhense]
MVSPHCPVAVVGVSALCPGSPDAERFWCNIVEGADLFANIPRSHWRVDDYYDPGVGTPDKMYATRGSFLPDVDFSPMDFGVPPNVVPATDTAQLLALMVAKQVLEDAVSGEFSSIDRDRVSVVLGTASATELVGHMSGRLQIPLVARALRAAGIAEDQLKVFLDRVTASYTPWQENTFPGLLGNVVAGRIANRFDLGGSNYVVDAACASSLASVQAALNELYLGDSDMVITGGVDALNDILMFVCFSKVTALSPSGDCRPFSDQADGTMLGEGLVMFALKRLEDAERDGDRIYAVIRGMGTSSDGRAKSIYAPSPSGQAKALRRAYQIAGYGPETVGLVEAHGTGTKAGDLAEFAALREVFDASGRSDRQWCALGSVKSQVGHTKGASGACGMFKAVMALHHKVLPPTIKVDSPNPALEIEQSPFYLSTQPRPWIAEEGVPRRASVSSFGFGGTNFHVTLEEYTGTGARARRHRSWQSELVVLGAETAAALAYQTSRLSTSLVDSPDMLSYIAHTTQTAYDAGQPHRLAVVADDVGSLRDMLDEVTPKLGTPGASSFSSPKGYYYSALAAGPVALLFPGQGSQYVGMGNEITRLADATLSPWETARAAHLGADCDLHQIAWPKPAFTDSERELQAQTLTRTQWAQPAIGAHSLSLLALVRDLGIKPIALGGHSFGEVIALCGAGVLSDAAGLRIAGKRGALMAEAASNTDGAMCAVSAPVEPIVDLLQAWGLPVVVANHNSPNQVVFSGAAEAIEEMTRRLNEMGIRATLLSVDTAFHSPIVAAATAPFTDFLADIPFGKPAIPVYANATAQPYDGDADAMRATLASQLGKPVRFLEQVRAMWTAGARTFIEVGPDGVLTTLVGKCLEGLPHSAIALDRKGKNGIRTFWVGLAQLVAAGVPMNLANLWADYRIGDDPRARTKPKLSLKINGANYGKPQIDDNVVNLPPAVAHDTVADPPSVPAQPAIAPVSAPVAPAPKAAAVMPPPAAVTQPMAAPVAPVATYQATTPVPMTTAEAVVAQAPALAAAVPDGGVVAVMLEVVADKTGYPVEMLDLSMALEADLGIDSIKRVEILSAVQQRVPWLPEVEAAAMAGLATLQEIVDYLAPLVGSPPTHHDAVPLVPEPPLHSVMVAPTRNGNGATPSAPSVVAAPPAPAAAVPDGGVVAVMLEVVADKTGYPVEMLDLSMALEADLGIDSIKRVEILSAVQQRVPWLPEVEAAAMAGLATLQEIVDYLAPLVGSPPTHNHGAPPPPQPPPHTVLVPPSPNGNGATPVAQAGDRLPFELAGASVARYVVRAIAAPARGMGMPGLHEATVVEIVGGADGVADALTTALRSRGIAALTVAETSADAVCVVHVGGLAAAGTREDALAIDRRVFADASRVAARMQDRGGVFVTVQDTGGTFGLLTDPGTRGWVGGIAALTKTAGQEWPKANVKAIDIRTQGQPPDAVAEQIVEELLSGGPELEVGLGSAHGRVTVVAEESEVTGIVPRLDHRDVIIVSGGARGVTATSVIALAQATHASFVLVGRTVLGEEPAAARGVTTAAELKRALFADAQRQGLKLSPRELERQVGPILAGREIRATIAAIQAAGSRVCYEAIDVCDREQLAALLHRVRNEFGSITGLVHGAGVVADASLSNKTMDQFDRVFDTKVGGLCALLDATAGDALKLILLFSSVSARSGNPGQADYAMANEVVNKMAVAEQARRGPQCHVEALGWGPWEAGMVTPGLAEMFRSRGIELIPLDAGARAFVLNALDTKTGDVEVVLGGGVISGGPQPVLPADGRFARVVAQAAAQPYLQDHCVKQEVVLPVVQVLEWFVRMAEACRPGMRVERVLDLRVLRGVPLTGYHGSGDVFLVRCAPVENQPARLVLTLLDAAGAPRYSAAIELGTGAPTPCRAPAPNAGADGLDREACYADRALFHGKAFQVVEQVSWCRPSGALAQLHGLTQAGWPDAPWATDPAALDGCLQVALLWGLHQMGRRTLPLHIGEIVLHRRGTADGKLSCHLHDGEFSSQRVGCDLTLRDADGAPIAKLRKVEMYAYAD